MTPERHFTKRCWVRTGAAPRRFWEGQSHRVPSLLREGAAQSQRWRRDRNLRALAHVRREARGRNGYRSGGVAADAGAGGFGGLRSRTPAFARPATTTYLINFRPLAKR